MSCKLLKIYNIIVIKKVLHLQLQVKKVVQEKNLLQI